MSTPLICIEGQPSEPSQHQEHCQQCRYVLHGVFSSPPRDSGLGLHCRHLLQRLHQLRCINQSRTAPVSAALHQSVLYLAALPDSMY
jgi:hypothetical protein